MLIKNRHQEPDLGQNMNIDGITMLLIVFIPISKAELNLDDFSSFFCHFAPNDFSPYQNPFFLNMLKFGKTKVQANKS